jgi:hypothetical protein
MSGKRFAVLDANGLVVNHILIADPLPAKYWPGYGKTLVPLEPCDCSAGAALDIVKLKITEVPQIGDTLNLETGTITKFQPQIVTVKDENGDDIQVASAPDVKLATDVDPNTVKTVTDKPTTETKTDKAKVLK